MLSVQFECQPDCDDQKAVALSLGVQAQFKLNTDESPSIATEYGIRSIPTVIIYKGGQRVDAVIGAVPKTTLMKAIDKYID